jgi:sugar phosphate permease
MSRSVARLGPGAVITGGYFGHNKGAGTFSPGGLPAHEHAALHRFGVPLEHLAILFFAVHVLNAISHLGAVWLAGRIGLLNTMVFTHLPSSIFLIAVPFAPSFRIAAIFFLLRESLVEMDVPTRQSYVAAVVQPHERTYASGITNLTRNVSWAVSSSLPDF